MSLERAERPGFPAGRSSSIDAPPPNPFVHRPRTTQKPWKPRRGDGPENRFPHLWRVMWSACVFPANRRLLPNGVDGNGSLAPPCGGGILGARYCERRERAELLEHPIESSADVLWDDVAGRLRGALNEKTFANWFSEVTPVSVDDNVFVLGVPN